MRRPRGPGGRFLTADEVAEIERTKGDGEGEGDKSLETPAKGTSGGGVGSGNKRKADSDNATPSKKTKTAAPPARSSAEDEDDDVSMEVQAILERGGIRVRLNATCIELMSHGKEVGARVDCAEGVVDVSGSHLLLAMGRTPNTADLGLEKAGLAHDAQGYIGVDNQLRTNVAGIWALGDCNGRGGFTHTSYNDFKIVAANLLDHEMHSVTDRIRAYNLYVDPPLGRCGMTERDALVSGRRVLIGRRPMTNVGRAIEKGETEGFMKVLVDADSKEFLGAAILGTGGDEVIHCILDLMYARAPYTVMQWAMHIHPTVSELIPTMLDQLRPLNA